MVSRWVGECFDGELHAKRIASLSDGVLGVLHSTSLADSAIGLALAQAHGLKAKRANQQIDRQLSNPGVDLGRLFTPWIRKPLATIWKSTLPWAGPTSTPMINRP